MESKENNVAKPKNRKFILYILIIIFIFSLGTLTYRIGSDIYAKKEAVQKEHELEKEKREKEVKEIKSRIKEGQEKVKREMEENDKKDKIDSFNRDFEIWSGTQTKGGVEFLIDDAITNNQKNKEHLIEFVFDGNSYGTDPNSIRSIKNNLNNFNNHNIQYYEVILDYNTEGYVYKVTIETK